MQPIDVLSRDERTALRAMVSALIAMGVTVPSGAQAEGWTGTDKTQHMAVSAAFGGIARAVTPNKLTAFGLAMAPGIAKELYDGRHEGKHTASVKDLAADAVGAAIGVYVGNCTATPRSFVCSVEF